MSRSGGLRLQIRGEGFDRPESALARLAAMLDGAPPTSTR